MSVKQATTDHPVLELLAARWSPYAFADRPVARAELASLFEAARWAASSYNEQPWRYIVATREDAEEHARLVSVLVEGNQVWARRAPVLALGVAMLQFARNGKPNRAAIHDLGAASAQLTFEATARGLAVHQMAGIEPERARERFAIPDGAEPMTAIAIGYPTGAAELPEHLRARDEAPRTRRPLDELVFTARFGLPARLG